MRKLHLIAGILMVVVFLATGQFLKHHHPPIATLPDAARLLYHSRQIYILAGGLVNLMLGLFLREAPARWRKAVQAGGSILLLLSPALLTVAFLMEPQRGFQADMLCSSAGLYALFGGCMAHLLSAK